MHPLIESNWLERVKAIRMDAKQAVELVKSGDRITTGHAAGEPTVLLKALMERKNSLRNVEICHMLAIGASDYCKPEYAGSFRHNSLFVGPGSREAVQNGLADYTPCFFSEIPRLFRDRILPVDVAMIQVSLPDEEGYCSFGVSVDYNEAATKAAKIVIAEMNPNMPFTRPTKIHVNDIDALVPVDVPLIEIPLPKIGEVERKIGAYVASLVPDCSNLQLGIGAIPDAVLKFLEDKKDLGIHTEMFSDGVVELVNRGVITNKYNNLNPGKLTASFLIGTKALYEFVDNNEDVVMKPVDLVNDVCIAGQVKNLISINSAVQVDLFGQVCADTLGPRQYSGVGGQVDFVRAASRSNGGKSIIALPSTARKGTIARITKHLDKGAAVTTSRNDVHYVVTEYGIAELRGKTLKQRAQALIEIAHPDFRDQLQEQAGIASNLKNITHSKHQCSSYIESRLPLCL